MAYTVTDNRGGTAHSTVTFHNYNSPPVAGTDVFEVSAEHLRMPEGTSLLDNDYDPDGDVIRAGYQSSAWLSNGAGRYSISEDGRLGFTRSLSFVGVVVIGYKVIDSLGTFTWGTVVLILPPMDGAGNAGESCSVSVPKSPENAVGDPANVTNGNMWVKHRDYSLPGIGENISIDRFYNSVRQSNGLFGLGWTTQYDESLTALATI